MIHLWAEIYDPTYTTQIHNSDILLVSASVDRVLDGPGRVNMMTEVLHSDFTSRALNVLTSKRVVEVWYQESERVAKMRKASFVIEDVDYQADQAGIQLAVRGVDTLSLLSNYTTSLGRTYDNQTISSIIDDLLPAGWTATKSGIIGSITARFDGTSVLKALQEIMGNTGFHFRQDASEFKRVVFSEFGTDSGYRLVKIEGDKPLLDRAENVIPIETIAIRTDSSEIVNKVIPLSAGDGDSRGTIEDSTVTSPYDKESEVGPDGRTVWYISDSESVAEYGEITKVLNFKKIAPIGVSDTSQQRTANYLHRAANEWLSRRVDPLTEIDVDVFQQRVNFSVGDKIRLEYVDLVNVAGSPVVLKSYDELFWVMSAQESYGADGEKASLKLASVDREKEDLGDQIVQAVDSVDVFATGYAATYNVWSVGPIYQYSQSSNAKYYLNIPGNVLRVDYVKMTVNTYLDRDITFIASGEITLALSNFSDSGLATYPTLDVDVNSTNVASNIGSTGAALVNYDIDITDEILAAGNDGRGSHLVDIDIGASGGNGAFSFMFEIQAVILPGRVV